MPEGTDPASISPVNRRITAMILAWVVLSLGTSVLPLVPGIGRVIPLELLSRESALVLHACTLLGFMGLYALLTLLAFMSFLRIVRRGPVSSGEDRP